VTGRSIRSGDFFASRGAGWTDEPTGALHPNVFVGIATAAGPHRSGSASEMGTATHDSSAVVADELETIGTE